MVVDVLSEPRIRSSLPDGPIVEDTPGDMSNALPACADERDIYHAQTGKTIHLRSFEDQIKRKIQGEGENRDNTRSELKILSQNPEQAKKIAQGNELFTQIVLELTPQLQQIISEMKKLGVINDIVAPESLGLLAYAIRVDQWGERPTKDYPQITEKHVVDERNPLNKIIVKEGKVTLETLNKDLKVSRVEQMLQQLYDTMIKLNKQDPSQDKNLRKFVEMQAVLRSVLEMKHLLKPPYPAVQEAKYIRTLQSGDVKQMSAEMEIWQTPEGRRIIVKRGPIHTLRGEVLENRIMLMMGMPVPETTLQKLDGEDVLIVGFLEQYYEEDDPFKLSEYYHASRSLQRGILPDILTGNYNRRPHNIMMKDGKIAFIDHGAATIGRSTGGFKGFSPEVDSTTLWDILRTIPDDNPNGDVPVNEAYENIVTVTGGPDGQITVKDPKFLGREVDRLAKLTDGQIEWAIEEAGYTDGPESIDQLKEWINSQAIKEKIAKLESKPENETTEKDKRDLRWTKEAIQTLEKAIQAGGLKSYIVSTLKDRRNNLVSLFQPFLEPVAKKAA